MQVGEVGNNSAGIETYRASLDLVRLVEASDIGCLKITVSSGLYIYRQSEPGEHFFIVRCGCVEISALLEAGQETIIDILGAGALCGEGAALDGATRLTSARTIVETSLLRFSAKEFKRSLNNNAALTASFLNAMAVKQRMLLRRLTEVTQLSPEQRVLKLLAHISENSAGGSINISHEKLARLIGLTRVTVTRTMGRLQKQGHLIKRNGRVLLTSNEMGI